MASKIKIFKQKSLLSTLVFATFTLFSGTVSANEPPVHNADSIVASLSSDELHSVKQQVIEQHEKVDIAEVAFEHILDAHSWHFWGEHESAVSMPLPVILKTEKGIVTFMSSEFDHDTHGKVVVEKNGERFVNYEEGIYYASETANEHGQYLNLKQEPGAKEAEVENAAPLDFSITKNVASMLLSVIIILAIFISVARTYKKTGITSAPRGKQSFLEPLVLFVRDDIAKSNIGDKSEKFVPYLLTVFFLILFNNLLGLIPGGANLTGNIAFTLVMAVITLIVTNINGNASYWGHILLPPVPKALWPIMIPIEIVGILTKPFALMIRLFANISAGHIIVISLVGLIFVFESLAISPVSIAFTLFIDVLELLVAFLQAYIFTMLTALFIGSAVAEHAHDDHHHDDKEVAHAH